jgi:hypothetical protein
MREILRSENAIVGTVTAALLALATVLMIAPWTAHAVTSISQSYITTEELPLGAIVSLKENTTDEIKAATADNADNIFGVTINAASSLLTLSGTKGTQVQVATGGTVAVLVSDINGEIKQGDAITASPISGVGMLATDNVRIIGMAQSDLKGGKKQTYKNRGGEQKTVTVGQVPILVNVAYFFKQPDKTIIPSAIQNLANGIAGKKVDSLPVLISGGIFIIMIIVVVSIVYTMVRSSIISVGRNPLSQSAVYRDLVQLSALVLAILAVGLVAIYLVLTKL